MISAGSSVVVVPTWTALALLFALPVVIYVLKTWITKTVESSVQLRSDTRLENLRGEIRASEERMRSDLRSKESQIDGIRTSVLSSRGDRILYIQKRRLEAVDNIWISVTKLSRLKLPAMMLSMMKIEAMTNAAGKNNQLRSFLESIAGDDILAKLGDAAADRERPFLSELSWALYSAYSSIIGYGIGQVKLMSIGIDKVSEAFDTDKVRGVLKSALADRAEFIDQHGLAAAFHLLDELENKLLKQLKSDLDAPTSDNENVAKSAEIMKQVSDLTAAQGTNEIPGLARAVV